MKFGNLTFRGKPIYYGWVIVVGMALVTMTSMSMLSINFGFFIEPISRELGIEQGYFGWAQACRLIGTAVSGFLVGFLLDRYGARRPLIVAGLLIAGAMLAMANITEGWQIVAIFVLIGLIGLQGAGANAYAIVSVSQWFVRKRSKAMSRAFLGNPIGIFITAPLTVFLIDSMGWRSALVILGFIGGAIIFLVALFVKRSPEAMGLLPDGDSLGEVQSYHTEVKRGEQLHGSVISTSDEYSWTRAEALRSAAFWKLAVAFGLSLFTQGTMMLFRIPYFVSRGIDPQIIAYSLSIEAVTIFIITFPLGHIATRFQLRYLLILSILVRVGALLTMIVTTEVWHVFLANALFGISLGSQAIILAVIWPNYFGRNNVGVIRGLSLPITTVLSFMGAPVAGMVFDAYGSYLPAWWAAIVILAISAVLFLVTPKPTPPVGVRITT